MLDIWQEVEGHKFVKPLMATVHRVTEDQHLIATMSLVNDIYEQQLLEEMLDATKPSKAKSSENLHYLLFTPFRYPPLEYGSRFGSRLFPSLFYSSLNITTALAEAAYYRFVFMAGMSAPYLDALQVTYSSYTISMRTQKGVFLDKEPFEIYNEILASKHDYQATQLLGKKMRESDIEAFQYLSARDKQKGKNIAIFTPTVFQSRNPLTTMRWICNVTDEEVGFASNDNNEFYIFKKTEFESIGILPSPAV